jgi:hypothetical protein
MHHGYVRCLPVHKCYGTWRGCFIACATSWCHSMYLGRWIRAWTCRCLLRLPSLYCRQSFNTRRCLRALRRCHLPRMPRRSSSRNVCWCLWIACWRVVSVRITVACSRCAQSGSWRWPSWWLRLARAAPARHRGRIRAAVRARAGTLTGRLTQPRTRKRSRVLALEVTRARSRPRRRWRRVAMHLRLVEVVRHSLWRRPTTLLSSMKRRKRTRRRKLQLTPRCLPVRLW